MQYRVEVANRPDCRDVYGESVCTDIRKFLDLTVESVRSVFVYILDVPLDSSKKDDAVREVFVDPLTQDYSFNKLDTGKFDWCVEIGFKPGVTDSIGGTAREAISDILKVEFEQQQKVYSGKQYRLTAPEMTRESVLSLAEDFLGNTLIETIKVQSFDEWYNSKPDSALPKVKGTPDYRLEKIDLDIGDEELMALSRERSLSLSLEEMRSIKEYFARDEIIEMRKSSGIGDKATDVELESLAQTWSEHCKHKIFNCIIDYEEDGKKERIDSLFRTYIMSATKKIGEDVDWLLSVFKDNAGVIKFNDRINLVYKVETHNTPSALEPYGGALTGIVGVNRDPMGTGLGADLLFNVWGYCFGSPFYDKKMPSGLLHPNRIRENVHKGVIDGGNQSGIPYARGWEYFDERYIGKPLVFCGTVGSMPVSINGNPTHEKKIAPGDLIVMAGGRIGKDGIHGATFSSEELHEDSPIQAVQIGDPITQKKLYDFLIHARNLGLYSFVTDNGAGGLSSSVGEMAQSSGGCYMDLTNAPLKYQGLDPWEILISEAQERMSFAVPPENKDELFCLAEKYGVEVTVLGEFTNSGIFHVIHKDETVAYLDMEFLHDGLPQMELKARWIPPILIDPEFTTPKDITETLKNLLGRLNICSIEGKSRQYDHEVKGLNIIKPFIGVERDIPSDATVVIVEHGSTEGIILAEGKNPSYSDIDTYHMAASVIDEAVRRIISTGGTLDQAAGLDNFCWPDPVQSEKTPDGHYKLAQLVRANKALFDFTTAYNVPCISGKDSMKNDCILEGKKISIPPTLLFSVIAKMNDITKAVTMDIKLPGDLVYIAGETFDELGSSEYYRMVTEQDENITSAGKNVPKVDPEKALKLYRAIEKITGSELAHSIHTPTLGGLGVGFAKMVMAGGYGMEIDVSSIPTVKCSEPDKILFSESNSRFIITVAESDREAFETAMGDNTFSLIGTTTEKPELLIEDGSGNIIISSDIDGLRKSWKFTFKDFFDGSS